MNSSNSSINREVQKERFKTRGVLDRAFFQTRKTVPYLRAKYQHELEAACEKKPERVLEVGCGEGTQSDYFPDSFYLGLDLSPNRIAAAKEIAPEKSFAVSDALNLAVQNESFDMVFCYGLLHHVAKKEVSEVMREMAAACRPGGRIVFMEPNAYSFFNWLLAVFRKPERGILHSKEKFYESCLDNLEKDGQSYGRFLFRENTPFVLFQILLLLRNTKLVKSAALNRFAQGWDGLVKLIIPRKFWQLLIIVLDKKEMPAVR